MCDCIEGDYEIPETIEERAPKEEQERRLELVPVVVRRRRARVQTK